MKNLQGTRLYLLAALIVSLLFSIYRALTPVQDFPRNTPGSDVMMTVTQGEFGSSIAHALVLKGVIKNSAPFIALANDKNSGANGISPGNHLIQTHLTSREALNQLLDRKRLTNLINVSEGSTLSDVMNLLRKDFNLVDDKKNVKPLLRNSLNSLEGQLAPASYSFAPKTSYSSALQSMVERFKNTYDQIGLGKGLNHFTPYQVLTVASMVQIEGDPTDFEKVAGVIYNRLAIGMPLQLNSTVQYAANLRGRISLSAASTQIQSPYNTYRHQGLPPSPISNPSVAAINAALHPSVNNFLYFITVKPHDTRFTASFAEFNTWVELYNKNLRAGFFK